MAVGGGAEAGAGEEARQDKDGEKMEVIKGKDQEEVGDKREYN